MSRKIIMELSIDVLCKLNACDSGIELYKQLGCPDTVESAVTLAMQRDRFSDCNWLLTRLFTKEQNVKYAIYAARAVLHIYESKYPDDPRPRKAIGVAEEYLRNPTAARAAAARAAADAAWAAAWAAADAAWAAARAARAAAAADAAEAAEAAWAAARAARAAAAADAAEAAEAAWAAADAADVKQDIINYGLTLLKGSTI